MACLFIVALVWLVIYSSNSMACLFIVAIVWLVIYSSNSMACYFNEILE